MAVSWFIIPKMKDDTATEDLILEKLPGDSNRFATEVECQSAIDRMELSDRCIPASQFDEE